ncbi:MAG: hypothetical protein RMY16_31245 [Nostoc sp. DedQUE12b]|uniref:hypothetical protein n=1 Tax=Nostoc sp. DedQUE12b TaxID=3075398 RepID=UPI002AD2C14E|nr:hypothetical protein [Nostoc sp. DedQUE12b]MDZ8089995.1 hypothetical protein [Nostoc sp. DedQUE12b]
MTNQSSHLPLFQAYKAHLKNLKSFLHLKKEKFQKIVETSIIKNKDNNYEKIVQDANNKIIEKINTAIQEISNSIERLEEEKERRIKEAIDTMPSNQKNI